MKTSLFFSIFLAVLLSFYSCKSEENEILTARLIEVADNIKYADSSINKESWGRCLIMKYMIINNTDCVYYMPLNKYYGHNSKLRICTSEGEKISSSCYIENESIRGKHRMDSCLIAASDTSIIFFAINNVLKAKENDNYDMATKDLLSILTIKYELDSLDLYHGCPMTPSIIFRNDTNDVEIKYKLDFKLKKK